MPDKGLSGTVCVTSEKVRNYPLCVNVCLNNVHVVPTSNSASHSRIFKVTTITCVGIMRAVQYISLVPIASHVIKIDQSCSQTKVSIAECKNTLKAMRKEGKTINLIYALISVESFTFTV